jgi:hypothetical protein
MDPLIELYRGDGTYVGSSVGVVNDFFAELIYDVPTAGFYRVRVLPRFLGQTGTISITTSGPPALIAPSGSPLDRSRALRMRAGSPPPSP